MNINDWICWFRLERSCFLSAISTGSWWRRTLKWNRKHSQNSNSSNIQFQENHIKTVSVTVTPCFHANIAAVKSSIMLISRNTNSHHEVKSSLLVPLDLWGTIWWKFGWNRPSNYAILARTDRQTHTHTHTQTTLGFRTPTSRWKYIQPMKMTECKNIFIFLPLNAKWQVKYYISCIGGKGLM